jgi:hypothetical protein
MKIRLTAILLLVVLVLAAVLQAGEKQVFSTWDDFEVDKLASVWLIRRHIAPGAEVLVFPRNQEIDKGVQFDTPYAPYKRGPMQSTFEALAAHFNVKDPKVALMGRLVHDIEINVWEKKVYKKSAEIQIRIMDVMGKAPDNGEILTRAAEVFDALYRDMPEELERNP